MTMSYKELGQVLGRIAKADGRDRSSEADLVMWHEVIGHLPIDIALEATVRVLSDSGLVWYRPAHVLQAAEAILAEIAELHAQMNRRGLELPADAVSPMARAHMRHQVKSWNSEALQSRGLES